MFEELHEVSEIPSKINASPKNFQQISDGLRLF